MLDALERKGLIESGGAPGDVYLDGVRWRVRTRSRSDVAVPRSAAPPEPPERYFCAVAQLASEERELAETLDPFGAELWPALLSSRVGFVGAMVCEVDIERRSGSTLPMESEWSMGASIREELSDALFDVARVGAHIAATVGVSIEAAQAAGYGKTLEAVCSEACRTGFNLGKKVNPWSLEGEIGEIQVVTGRLASSIKDVLLAESGDLNARMAIEAELPEGPLQSAIVEHAVELVARGLALKSLVDLTGPTLGGGSGTPPGIVI